jgi:hypothetical protein
MNYNVVFVPVRSGRLAQLVRAPALQAGGRRFESCTAHHEFRMLSLQWMPGGRAHARAIISEFPASQSANELRLNLGKLKF